MTIGERLRTLREKRDLTLEEVAQRTGLRFQNIWKYENDGVKNIPDDKVEALAKVYGVHPAYIKGWTDFEDGPREAEETEELMEELHKNPELRILLSASKDVPAESLHALIEIAKKLKGNQ